MRMSPVLSGILVLGLLVLVLSDVSFAALRCGTRLVREGDTKAEVIHKCGEPSHVDSWKEEHIAREFYGPVFHRRAWEYSRYRAPFVVQEQVNIEVWTYNFGSTQFIRYLRFENGVLKDISIGGYGH